MKSVTVGLLDRKFEPGVGKAWDQVFNAFDKRLPKGPVSQGWHSVKLSGNVGLAPVTPHMGAFRNEVGVDLDEAIDLGQRFEFAVVWNNIFLVDQEMKSLSLKRREPHLQIFRVPPKRR